MFTKRKYFKFVKSLMKITIFTGASKRHDFLIKSLINHDLFVIRENKKSYSFLKSKFFKKNKIVKSYFQKVKKSENQVFKNVKINKKKLKLLKNVKFKRINDVKLNEITDYLKSDLYIVFGSSFIKNNLLKFLIRKKCINIHMGISPYYKGSNCNFWAIYDGNYHLVGATIHRLTSKLDGGNILFQTISKRNSSPFVYSMKNVKSAISLLKKKIDNNTIINLDPKKQNKSKVIRYSKNSDFSEKVIKDYPKKIGKFKFKKKMLIRPELLND